MSGAVTFKVLAEATGTTAEALLEDAERWRAVRKHLNEAGDFSAAVMVLRALSKKDGFRAVTQVRGEVVLSRGEFATPDEAADALADELRKQQNGGGK